jgi:hypothetical protein
MDYGWRLAAGYLSDNQKKYENVFIEKAAQPQAMVAFYLQVDPRVFQQASSVWTDLAASQHVTYLDQMDTYSLDRYTFKHLNFPEDIKLHSLYLSPGPFELLPKSRKTLYTVTAGAAKPQLELFTFDRLP